MKKTPIIHTQRLCLHAICDNDKEAMLALLTNAEVGKTYMVPEFHDYAEQVRLFEALKRLSEKEDRFVYGIFCKEQLIGLINDVEIQGAEIELGYAIHPEHKNKGYATEALKAAIQSLLEAGFSVVKTGAFAENLASIRVMEKCGMTPMDQEDRIEYRGQEHRCIYYRT